MPKYLTIALPKGKLFAPSIRLLRKVQLPVEGLLEDTRQMVFEYPVSEFTGLATRYIVCRSTDIPIFVEYGSADLGITGKDTIFEENKNVFELVDLKYGYCRFVVAAPAERVQPGGLQNYNHARVATKFPRVAETFFTQKGVQVEILKLHGNIELAPSVGLSELIVDIVSSGRTLRENNLVPIEDIFPATARLIANRVSFRMQTEVIQALQEKMRAIVEKEDLEADDTNSTE